MATQTIEFIAVTGQTVTAKLFSAGSDTVVASVSATEATNRKGLFTAAFTDVAAGTYRLLALTGSTPLAAWWVDLTLATATFQAYEMPISTVADGVWDEVMSGHTTDGTYGGRIVRATNSNVSVQITGSNHIAADVHACQTDGLTLSTDIVRILDRCGYLMAQEIGACSDAGTSAETYAITINSTTYTIDHTGLDATGNRGSATLTKT